MTAGCTFDFGYESNDVAMNIAEQNVFAESGIQISRYAHTFIGVKLYYLFSNVLWIAHKLTPRSPREQADD